MASVGTGIGLEPDAGVFERLEEEVNDVDWSLDASACDVPGNCESMLLWGIVVPSGPETVMDGLWTESSVGEQFWEGFGGDVGSVEGGAECPFSLTFPGARSGESGSASLSLPPFLDFFEADWPCPIARFW